MNAMMWVRGFAADYDDWAQVAGEQWSFANIAPYFKRIEAVEGATESDEGTDGALKNLQAAQSSFEHRGVAGGGEGSRV